MFPDTFSPSLSDIFLLIGLPFAAWFPITYSLGSPWYKVKRHGWIGVMTLLHSLSVAALLFLIVWGIVYGQRIDEAFRLPISAVLALAFAAKVAILHAERRRGRIMRRDRHEREKHHGSE